MRLRLRLSLRTLVDLVGLVALALGFRVLWDDTRPPRPSVRALRLGDEAERVAALRSLGLLGEAGIEAIPALIRAARDDPSPGVRRGAVHALTGIVLVGPGAELPIDEVIAGPTPGPKSVRRPGRVAPPLIRTRGDEVAMHLVEVMQSDPDPSVRAYALRALRKVLDVACNERSAASRPRKPGAPAPKFVSSGGWVEAATRAVADAVADPDPSVRNHAVGFLVASQPAKSLLSKSEQLDALRRLIGDDAPRLPAEMDLLVLANVAGLMGPDHAETPRLIDRLAARIAHPPPLGVIDARSKDRAVDARAGYAAILWGLVISLDDLRTHPDAAEVLVDRLSGNWQQYMNDVSRVERLIDALAIYTADLHQRSATEGHTSYYGGLAGIPDPRSQALRAIARDPRLLAHVWPRVDRDGRLAWLAATGPARPGWDVVFEVLADPAVLPDLPREECEAVLARLLDEPEPDPTTMDTRDLRSLVEGIEQDRKFRGRADSGHTAIEEACVLVAMRNLAVLAYFARGASPGHPAVARLVDRLRARLDAPDDPVPGLAARPGSSAPAGVMRRAFGAPNPVETHVHVRAARLLGSLGPAALTALPALIAHAAFDPDADARGAALAAAFALTDPTDRRPSDDDR